MEKAQQVTPQEIVAEVKEEMKEEAKAAPSRLLAKLRRFEAMWGRAGAQFYEAPKN